MQTKTTIRELKAKSTPFKPFNLVLGISIFFVVAQSWIDTQMSLGVLFEGWGNMLSYLEGNPSIENSGFFPPNMALSNLEKYFLAMVETLEMAVVAILISIVFALPLSFLCSRNILDILFPQKGIVFRIFKRVIYFVATLFANVCRSVNEIVWALIFVTAVGLGPMAGILALAIHTTGALAKLLSEGNENIDPNPIKALESMGVGFIKILVYGIIPQVMPHYISMILYRFESDVRSASILGFVGAGGIGFYLFDSIRSFDNGNVCTILIVIVCTVFVIDKVSAFIRKHFI